MALFETFSSIFFVFIFLPHTSTSLETCNPSSCPGSTVTVQFPFSLINNQTSNRCGYPGFNISCTNNQTTLNLPKSGQFIILDIDYPDQNIWITDPDNCMPQRFLNGFNITGTVFDTVSQLTNFTLLNCSYSSGLSRSKVPCLSGDNYTVSAVTTSSYQQSDPITSCSVMTTVLAPFSWPYGLTNEVQLAWSEPDCGSCEGQGGTCGFTSNTGLDVGCSVSVSDGSTSNKSGLPRAAKYGIAIGAGIPGLLCLVGLSCFVCGKVRDYGLRRRRQPNTELSTSINPHPVIVVMGLDEPTIEKFPKTLLGESRRLPKPSDNVCPICLSEYQPKETLRTIPECNHYFHANCIDEWLKMNATCPLCRNSPDESSIASSPSSSLSSSSSPSSSSL